MTQEALKLALDALIQARKIRFAQWRAGCDCDKEHTCNPLQDSYARQFNNAIIALEDYMKEQTQEPVAWMDADGNVSDNNDHKCFPIPLYTHPPQQKNHVAQETNS